MFKKIIITFILIVNIALLNTITYWADTPYKDKMNSANAALQEAKKSNSSPEIIKTLEENAKNAKEEYGNSAEAAWDVTTTWFTIFVDDISPGMWPVWWTTKENVNFVLWTIIQNLMIALWSLALLIMTIWAGYILLHHGQDELLSKWKAIFMSWVYAMVVALSSYYLISIVRYILYFGNN